MYSFIKAKSFLFFLLIIFINGCSNKVQPSISEQIKIAEKQKEMSKYFFKDVNKIEIAQAIEKVFRLSDGNDYSISYEDSKIDVKKSSIIYAVVFVMVVNDRWEIFLDEKDNGVLVSIKTYLSSQEMLATFPEREIVKGDLYNLFFKRIEYILGKNNKWQTCEEIKELNPNADYSLLCFMSIDINPTIKKEAN